MITGIIIALADEISSLTDKKVNRGNCVFINDKTLLVWSGTGAENAKKASQLLIKNGAERLISWGCAAALEEQLNPGDLILADRLQAENHAPFSIDSAWLAYLMKQLVTLNPITGLLIESLCIIEASEAKKNIHQQTQAIALDMESVAIAQVAIQHHLPVLVIRSIADPVSMSLPKAVRYAINPQGDVVLSKLLWFLLIQPSELLGLIKLGLHFRAAKNKLKLVAKHLDIMVGFE